MQIPMRVLIVENGKAERFIARQLLDSYDLEFTCQSVASESELRDLVRHFKPSLVYCADDLPTDSRSDALGLLRLLSLRTAVIHVAQTDGRCGTTVSPVVLKPGQARVPQDLMATVERTAPRRRSAPPPLPDLGGNAIAMSDFAGWITYANTAACGLLQDPSGNPIGTVLGRDYDFAFPPCGAQRLAIFDAQTGCPGPLHLSNLIGRAVAPERKNFVALPMVALGLALGPAPQRSGAASGAGAPSEEVLRSLASQFLAQSGGHGMIARLAADVVLVIVPDAAQIVSAEPPMLQAALAELPAVRRPPLEASLVDALQRHAIGVHYQPQFELQSGRGCGVEALARWEVASGDSIAPLVFIPIAERAGMIHSLGESVLKDACMTAAAWRGRDQERLTVSVNVSTLQINKSFARTLSEAIENSGLRPSRLELEIAESAVLSNEGLTAACLKEWKQLGVRVAVNHAGQNYSSLSYLSRLSIDRLKLDKSLIQSMTPAKKTVAIVHALISLGAELGIEVIAEGVESAAQFQLLAELGCQQVQGYLLARPAPAVQAQLALRKSWGSLPQSVRRPASAVAERCAS